VSFLGRLLRPIPSRSAPPTPAPPQPPATSNGSGNPASPGAARAPQQAAAPAAGGTPAAASPAALGARADAEWVIDLQKRRDQLQAKVAELQWDLGGLAYEMAVRNQVKVNLLVERAAALQDVDAELNEVERILRVEQTATAGACPACGAPHSSGAGFCWQCGRSLLEQVPTQSIVEH
jgi:hypothetical protein